MDLASTFSALPLVPCMPSNFLQSFTSSSNFDVSFLWVLGKSLGFFTPLKTALQRCFPVWTPFVYPMLDFKIFLFGQYLGTLEEEKSPPCPKGST